MTILPRSRRGIWLFAAAVWLAACSALWWALPVVPDLVIKLDSPCWKFNFTPDGSHIACFSGDFNFQKVPAVFTGRLTLWNTATGKLDREPLTWPARQPPRVVSRDHRWWALDIPDSGIRLLNLETMTLEPVDLGIPANTEAAEFSADSRYLILRLSVTPSRLAVWDIAERRLVGQLPRLQSPFGQSSDGKLLAAVERDTYLPVTAPQEANKRESAHIVEINSLREIAKLESGDSDFIGTVELSPGNSFLLTIVGEQPNKPRNAPPRAPTILRCFDIKTARELFAVPWTRQAFFQDNSTLLAVCNSPNDNHLEWREPATGRVLRSRKLQSTMLKEPFLGLLSPDRTRLVVYEGPIHPSVLEDFASRHRISWPFQKFYEKVCCAVYDVQSGERLAQIPAQNPCWSPDGLSLATPMSQQPPYDAVSIWSIPPHKPLAWFIGGAALLGLLVVQWARRRVRSRRIQVGDRHLLAPKAV